MMKLIILLLIMSCQLNSYSQDVDGYKIADSIVCRKNIYNVESVFKRNIKKIKKKLASKNKFRIKDPKTKEFLSVYIDMSGNVIPFDTPYDFIVSKKELSIMENWYNRNKNIITPEILHDFYMRYYLYYVDDHDYEKFVNKLNVILKSATYRV